MKKTSLYLSAEEVAILQRFAAATGRPQSRIVRDAIVEYAAAHLPPRRFEFIAAGASERDGTTSIADDIEERMEGFGLR